MGILVLIETGVIPQSPVKGLLLSISYSTEISIGSLVGSVCWGQITGVLETNSSSFANHWSGTGSILSSGDAEHLSLGLGAYLESDIVDTLAVSISLDQNVYAAGNPATLKYRTGSTPANCSSAAYTLYAGPFLSSGFVQVRVEN